MIRRKKGIIIEPLYGAPESHRLDFTEKVDIWSCGVLMHILLVGDHPFDGVNDNDILERTMTDSVYMNTKDWDYISTYAKHLLNLMLIKD